MMSTKKLLIFIIMIGQFQMIAQHKIDIDSLFSDIIKQTDTPKKVDELIELNWKSNYQRPDIIEDALSLAKKMYYIDGIAKAYNAKGMIFKKKNQFVKSVEYYKRGLGFLDKSQDTILKIIMLNNLGVSLRKLNDEKTAYKYYMQALSLAKNIHNTKHIARVLNGIGNVFVNTEEYKKALFYFKKSLDLEFKNKNLIGQEYNYANIGEIFIYTKQYDSAEYYLKKSLNLAKVLYKSKQPGIEYNLLAFLYKNKGDYTKAVFYYDKAIPILVKQNIKRYIANSYINRGLSKLPFKKYEEALSDINQGIEVAKSINSKENISLGYDALVQYYSSKKKYKKALEAHVLAKKFHDSIVNVTTKNNIITTQILYESKEKDQKIKQLAYEKELEKKVSNRNFWIMIGVIVLSGLTIVFLYLFFSLRRKNIDLQLEQQKSEIHSYILKINELKEKMKQKGTPKTDIMAKLKQMDLTKREIDVLQLIAEGYTNEQIADKMFISKNTVKSHIKNIYLKLDVKNRIQVVRKLQEA